MMIRYSGVYSWLVHRWVSPWVIWTFRCRAPEGIGLRLLNLLPGLWGPNLIASVLDTELVRGPDAPGHSAGFPTALCSTRWFVASAEPRIP